MTTNRRTTTALALASVLLPLAACSQGRPSEVDDLALVDQTTHAAEREVPEALTERWFQMQVDLPHTRVVPEYTSQEATVLMAPVPARPSVPHLQKQVAPLCAHDRGVAEDGGCHVRVSCAPKADGDRYRLQMRTVVPGQEPPSWQTVGEACFTPDDLQELNDSVVAPGPVTA